MRLFVAVELPSSVREAAAVLNQTLRDRVSQIAPRARLTLVAPDRLHITVRFIGEVDETQGNALAALCADPLNSPAFALTLGAVGAFPPHGAPRTLWVAIGAGREAVRRVEQEISARLEQAGIGREPRAFNPHLTLARVRDPRGLHSTAVFEGVVVPPHDSGQVDAITLFESRLSPNGPTYRALQRTPLRRR